MSRSAQQTTPQAMSGIDTRSHKEDATLRRVIGFVASASLLAAVLWRADLGETAEPAGARDASQAQARAAADQPARLLLQAGRAQYLNGQRAEAMATLAAVEARADELTQDERDSLRRLIVQINLKRQAAGPAGAVVARGQSGDAAGGEQSLAGASQRSDIARKKLAEARRKFNAGQIVEAEKLAHDVQDLKVRPKLFGESADRLLEDIKEYRKQEAAWKKDSVSVKARQNRSTYLLLRARQLISEGEMAAAERQIQEAEHIKVKRNLADPTPEKLRTEMARRMATSRPGSDVVQAAAVVTPESRRNDIRRINAEEEEPALAEDPAEESLLPAARTAARPRATLADRSAPSSSSSANQARARELLKQAEADLNEGRLEEAKAKVKQADKLDVAYDDAMAITPDYMLAMIERAERDGLLARNQAPQKPSRGPAAKESPARKQALALTQQAQEDFEAGRIEAAKSKAGRAKDLDVAYELLDPTPDDVMESIEQREDKRYVASRQSQARVPEEIEEADAPEMPGDEIARTDAAADNDADAEEPAVVRPSGLSAQELYLRGKQAMRAGDVETATRCFLEAHQSGEQLDTRKTQEINEYLAQHSRGRARKIQLLGTRQIEQSELGQEGELPRRIDVVDEQRQVALEKLRTEVRNSVFRAERLAETDPQTALTVLDKAQASVENSGLEGAATGHLLKSLAKSRDTVEYLRRINAPRIEQAHRKKEVESIIKNEEKIKIRIEQDFAERVEKFNELLKQKRFEEAEVLALQARQLMPQNPVAEVMVLKSKIAKQDTFNTMLREKKSDKFLEQMNDVELAATGYVSDIEYPAVKKWGELTQRRAKYKRADNRIRTKEEERIYQSLNREVSLHFDNQPLTEVIKHLASLADVNIVLDPAGLNEEGVATDTSVTINVDNIRLKSALNLLLEHLRLGHTVKDEVLMITSKAKQQGELVTQTYSVADLVIPIKNFEPSPGLYGLPSSGSGGAFRPSYPSNVGGQMNVTSTGGMQRPSGQAFAQVDERESRRRGALGLQTGATTEVQETFGNGGGAQADFNSLMDLITTTIQPESWEDLNGAGSVMPYRSTLSLVIRQTQAVHEEIADLLGQLRRLQDLQVTIEVRFVTVNERFFERIGIDFDFNLPSNVSPGAVPNTFGQALPPFGNGIDFTQFVATAGTTGTTGGTTGTTGGTTGTTGGAAAAGAAAAGAATTGSAGNAPFGPGPTLDTANRSTFGRYGAIAGILPTNTFSPDLAIPFRNGSFGFSTPQFGNFQADAGLSVGFAILSDIETFFLINAAQGDTRTNLLFAPKVTLFNGQFATVQDTVQRPFVVSLTPTVGFFSVGFQPQIAVIPDGVFMFVQAVISADRRYVRLTVIPNFTAITDVQSFSFVSGAGSATTQGNTGGGGGGGLTGFGGGFGGGQGAGFGAGGIGGTTGGTTGTTGTSGGTTGTTGASGAGQAGGTNITIQRPIVEVINVSTTVSVPDGGTVLLGGIKRLREGRTMAGVPILNKIPYISRLFKNTGVGRETESLMLMVTPRIIIQEEEEELLGVPPSQ